MRYSLEQLEMFSRVVKTGSFSAAARSLGKTQSTISMAIANLEVDWGLPLFDRTSKLPVLTVAGRKLLNEVELVLERCLDLESHANELGDLVEPKLTLAIEVPYKTLMPAITDFSEQFPNVDLDIRHPMHGDVSDLLLKGEVDLGVAFAQPAYPRDLGFSQMGKLILAHIARHDHPLARLPSVSFAELRSHRRLVFSAHNNTLPSTEYLDSARSWQAESYLALLEMTRAGLGWTTLPRQLILRELADGEFVDLQLEAYPHTDWLVGVDLIWLKTRLLGKAGVWLKRRLQEHKVYELDRNGNATTL
ncbi:LysR family transcriptional regulator [Paraburkholderia sp. MMS20-SJTR3]|uniref:LysR family transcriptional regulator n=1 Tax=Paraburkholderia sejongensis TaxID=2886946 RepID=A0ABS8JRR0_9BURK|nr:LysR family transcriptional regulator [Paraburkholderia sp. MMS20-SJTR3]MCC8392542.1 LysR family transcriptional regulator [Paraburkholderia sp. MMS20-SJTR3]